MLLDYITTLGNFDAPYIRSGLYANGYFDLFNVGSDALSNEQSKKYNFRIQTLGSDSENKKLE